MSKTRPVTVQVAYNCTTMQQSVNAGLNGMAIQLIAESFGDKLATKFPDGAIMFSYPFSHDKKPIWVIVTGESPFVGDVSEQPVSAALLKEALEMMKDGDPIECWCEKVGDGGKIVVERFTGECLLCRIRAVLGETVVPTKPN